jgi:cytochrome c556
MFRPVVLAVALVVGATGVFAATDAIKERQALMKAQGAASKDPYAMLKGQAAFDLAKVKKALSVYIETGRKFPTLFPADSKTGETAAAPKIWEDNSGFKAAAAKLEQDAMKADAEIKDEASFKAAFPTVLKNCGSCHETYRLKKG